MSDLISREAAIEEILSWAVCINKPQYLSREDTLTVLNSIPTIDAVQVVRCGECVHRGTDSWCEYVDEDPEFFCSRGERRDK